MNYTEPSLKPAQYATGLVYDLNSLLALLLQVKDPRKPRGKQYPLAILFVLILLAKLCGDIADWVAYRTEQLKELNLLPKQKAPCHMTYRRILQFVVSPQELERLVGEYHRACLKTGPEIVFSLDGKTLKGRDPRHSSVEPVGARAGAGGGGSQGRAQGERNRGGARDPEAGQPGGGDRAGGCLRSQANAHTQRETSERILQAGGQDVWVVKGNQARTRWAIEKLFVLEACKLQEGRPLSKEIRTAEQVNKGHGRTEKRTLWVSSQLNDYLDWPGVAQVFRLERRTWHARYQGFKRQVVYGLTSLSPQQASPKKLLRLLRGYWGIENGLHYRRDVTLREDATRLTVGQAGHVMAVLNNLVLGLCLGRGYSNLSRARRLFGARPELALDLLCSTPSHSC